MTKDPGWYTDPENGDYKRYWDGSQFVGSPELNKPAGWYPDPTDASVKRFWDGQQWITPAAKGEAGSVATTTPVATTTVTGAAHGLNQWGLTPTEDAKSNRGYLWFAYVVGAIIPVIGICCAIYLAVSERRAAIRRHAIGVGAVAILAAAIWIYAVISVNNSNVDSRVVGDLKSLLDDHSISYSDVTCSHQGGNQYSCIVTTSNGPQAVQVTDDGKSIVEQGISAGG
jgi:Protein of unknown function (DUF2510)